MNSDRGGASGRGKSLGSQTEEILIAALDFLGMDQNRMMILLSVLDLVVLLQIAKYRNPTRESAKPADMTWHNFFSQTLL